MWTWKIWDKPHTLKKQLEISSILEKKNETIKKIKTIMDSALDNKSIIDLINSVNLISDKIISSLEELSLDDLNDVYNELNKNTN